jgi:hypothetical protein
VLQYAFWFGAEHPEKKKSNCEIGATSLPDLFLGSIQMRLLNCRAFYSVLEKKK